MLVMTKKHQICSIFNYHNAGPIMNFLSVSRTLVIDVFDVRVCYRLMAVAIKAMHTTSQLILLESLFSDV